jgi:hypothetical protein
MSRSPEQAVDDASPEAWYAATCPWWRLIAHLKKELVTGQKSRVHHERAHAAALDSGGAAPQVHVPHRAHALKVSEHVMQVEFRCCPG